MNKVTFPQPSTTQEGHKIAVHVADMSLITKQWIDQLIPELFEAMVEAAHLVTLVGSPTTAGRSSMQSTRGVVVKIRKGPLLIAA